MSKFVLTCVAVLVATALMAPGSAFAQTSPVFNVSDVIEAPNSQFTGGVSAARCGSNIVVGFEDRESSPTNSSAGYALSRNNGASFSDVGVLPVSQDNSSGFGQDSLGSDIGVDAPNNGEYPAARTPSIACVDSSLFYYATVYYATGNADFKACFGNPECAAISLSISKDGGASWGLPVPVAAQSGDIHDLIFPTISVDPSAPRNLYIAMSTMAVHRMDSIHAYPRSMSYAWQVRRMQEQLGRTILWTTRARTPTWTPVTTARWAGLA
jgi:hypothetical protein